MVLKQILSLGEKTTCSRLLEATQSVPSQKVKYDLAQVSIYKFTSDSSSVLVVHTSSWPVSLVSPGSTGQCYAVKTLPGHPTQHGLGLARAGGW